MVPLYHLGTLFYHRQYTEWRLVWTPRGTRLFDSLFSLYHTTEVKTIRIAKTHTMTVSSRLLMILAALVWCIGGIILLFKGIRLLLEAESIYASQPWTWLVVVLSLFLGSIKARFVFIKTCKKNVARIAALEQPRIWQFYRPRFFVILAIIKMIGMTLSRLAQNHYVLLLGVALLDLSIAIALLGSGFVYFTHNKSSHQTR